GSGGSLGIGPCDQLEPLPVAGNQCVDLAALPGNIGRLSERPGDDRPELSAWLPHSLHSDMGRGSARATGNGNGRPAVCRNSNLGNITGVWSLCSEQRK